MKRFSFPKKLLIGLTSFLFLFVAGTRMVHAAIIDWGNFFGAATGFVIGGPIGAVFGFLGGFDWLGGLGGGLFSGLAGAIAQLLVGATVGIINIALIIIGKILFSLANGLVALALEINSAISSSTVVQTGFNIVLNIANIGLVVAIIAIAFMVMLRRPGATKLLPRFIAVALLINFSFLIITNFFLEPVNQITDVLKQAANFDFNSFAKIFVLDTIDFGEVINDSELIDTDMDNSGWIAEVAIELISVVFLVAFIIVGVIALTAFAAMLMVRYVALSFLIVMMPIAWVTWIFPNLKIPGGNPFNVWWENFSRWLLFAPISMFFFFLAIQTAVAPDIVDRAIDAEVGTLAEIGIATGNMVLVVGFMLGGLIVANKMSITGAGYALGITKKLGKYARDKGSAKLKSEVAKGTVRALNAKPVKKRLENLSSAGSGSDSRTIRTLGAIPRALGRTSMDAAQRGENYVFEQTKKKYANYAPYRMKALLEQENLPRMERMAIQSIMQEKGYAWETNVGKHAGQMYEKGEFAKYGGQKTQISMLEEGLDPRVIAAIGDGKRVDHDEIGALMRARYDTLDDSALTGIGDSILADYDKDVQHYGFSEEQHDALRQGFLNYISEDRASVLTKVRGRQTRSGKANLNRAAQAQLSSGYNKDILDTDKKGRIALVRANWEKGFGIKEEEIKRRVDAIDAVQDTKWKKGFDDKGNPLDRELEKIRIRAHIEALGPEGFLGELHALDNSQKDMYSALLEGTGADADTNTTTTDST